MLFNVFILVLCNAVGIVYVYARKFSRRPVGIHDLPFELLSEIASHLDFVDVISLRQSTKKLRRATETRVVWYSLAKKYTARHFNIPRPENGTLDTLKTDGLREWIWPRLVIDQVWQNKIVSSTTRTLYVRGEMGSTNLLPGGRWLLTVRHTGQVDFYDLNVEVPVPQLLLGPLGPHEEVIGTPLVIDINSSSPLLDFTFTFSSAGVFREQEAPPGGLHVQRAQLTQAGLSTTLTAHKLISIPHIRQDAGPDTIGFKGDLVARNIGGYDKDWIEIFKWKECTSTELMFASIRVERGCEMIYFVGEDRILCVAKPRILIYQIPPFFRLLVDWDPAVGYQSQEDVSRPLWSYTDKPLALRGTPSFYFDGLTSYRLIVQDKTNLLGVCIPLSPDCQPYVYFRMDPPFSLHIGTGLYKACAMPEDAPVIRIGYGWNGNFIHTQGKISAGFLRILLDEETGRCLFGKNGTFQIVDFVSNSYQSI